MLILFIFEVDILKIIYNMASSKINFALKVIVRMILPLQVVIMALGITYYHKMSDRNKVDKNDFGTI